mmetsp:Transcript_5878/g.12918  ORF Transcript_5878/g.12918 Transcript_5878/m.12918 type:complete len:259 (-) Transcript_5878:188-964(-)
MRHLRARRRRQGTIASSTSPKSINHNSNHRSTIHCNTTNNNATVLQIQLARRTEHVAHRRFGLPVQGLRRDAVIVWYLLGTLFCPLRTTRGAIAALPPFIHTRRGTLCRHSLLQLHRRCGRFVDHQPSRHGQVATANTTATTTVDDDDDTTTTQHQSLVPNRVGLLGARLPPRRRRQGIVSRCVGPRLAFCARHDRDHYELRNVSVVVCQGVVAGGGGGRRRMKGDPPRNAEFLGQFLSRLWRLVEGTLCFGNSSCIQ